MWQKHTTVVNKLDKSTEDNGEDLSNTLLGSRLQMASWKVTQNPERNDSINGKLKSADTDGARVYNDHITAMFPREL